MINKTLLSLVTIAFLMGGCSEHQPQPTAPVRSQKNNQDVVKLALLLKFNQAVELQKQRDYSGAIEIYDQIINYYRGQEDKGILASAYINKFECSLLINRGYREQDIADFLQRFGHNEQKMMGFEVLYILDGAKVKSMDNKLAEWREKYNGQKLEDWTFMYIDDWATRMENAPVRNRVKRYVSIFKRYL